ncbi:MAG: hypothetical protein O2894_01050 [Planctomycetota bacterium]|nr:hypothetical protein [Planctomycetota bacterium]
MFAGLRRPRGDAAAPLPPGPRGRILFVGPFSGGIGGVERITRCFAEWVRTSGFTCTLVVRDVFPEGPFSIASDDTVRVLPERAWGPQLAEAAWDFVYVIGAGLARRRWIPRLRALSAPRVVLDLDRKRKWLEITDVLHCEAPRADALPRPHVVAMPDPRPTMARTEAGVTGDYYLTVFNPYGSIKGSEHVPAFVGGAGKRLVWAYDLSSWRGRSRKLHAACRRNLAAAAVDGVELIEAPSQTQLYDLYADCAGYVCFSRDESLGFAMLDALALGKPLAARHIGVCRALPGFEATEDFAHPRFRAYPLPATLGYGALFAAVPAALAESAL